MIKKSSTRNKELDQKAVILRELNRLMNAAGRIYDCDDMLAEVQEFLGLEEEVEVPAQDEMFDFKGTLDDLSRAFEDKFFAGKFMKKYPPKILENLK